MHLSQTLCFYVGSTSYKTGDVASFYNPPFEFTFNTNMKSILALLLVIAVALSTAHPEEKDELEDEINARTEEEEKDIDLKAFKGFKRKDLWKKIRIELTKIQVLPTSWKNFQSLKDLLTKMHKLCK